VATLREFGLRFQAEIKVHCAGKPRTIDFWNQKLTRLLEFEPLSSSQLDKIDKALIASYVPTRHGKVAVATINRELATLRRMLYLAHDWSEISAVPRIQMLKGERSRDFVLSHHQEKTYLEAASQPLKDVAILLLETGLRLGEALANGLTLNGCCQRQKAWLSFCSRRQIQKCAPTCKPNVPRPGNAGEQIARK
jgi:integrase